LWATNFEKKEKQNQLLKIILITAQKAKGTSDKLTL
jgi:hypothetical protein